MAHPGEICRCLDEERKNANSNDGLYSRFLLCMPQPEFRDADNHILPNTPGMSRSLYVVDQLHRDKKTYIYDEEAQQVAMSYYNEQQHFLREDHSTDTYLSGITGKLKGHTQRLSMILQAVNNASQLLDSVGELDDAPITAAFKKIIKSNFQGNEDLLNSKVSITVDNTNRSIKSSKYFLAHQKFLYDFTPSGVVDRTANVSQLARKIVLHPGLTVPCNSITKSSRFNADRVKEEMRSLSGLGIGETKLEKPVGRGRLIFTFHKKELCSLSLEETVELTNNCLN